MNHIPKIPFVIEKFIEAKICTQVPLLPCIYGGFEKMQDGLSLVSCPKLYTDNKA